MTRYSLVLGATCALVFAACDDATGLSRRDLLGTWLSAWPRTAQLAGFPDTLVLDGRGGGRLAVYADHGPASPGGPARTEWMRAPLRYRIERDTVYFQFCLQSSVVEVACPPAEWNEMGRIADDGMLWIGPTSLAASRSALPWKRVGS